MVNWLVVLAPDLQPQAQQLAHSYDLTVTAQFPHQEQYYLCLDHTGLSLRSPQQPKSHVQIDFVAGANAHRRKFGGGLGQDIAKAVGVSARYQPSVFDATAGLGRDAFVLASLGCQVTAFERHPCIAALLADGLMRAQSDAETAAITACIQLHYGSSLQQLAQQAQISQPDVIYLDPMFAQEGKQKAQVKKDMAAFHTLVGHDDDADLLLALALANARCRVVVKRARHAPALANQAPSYQLLGKSNRFDVYALAKVAPLGE